MKVLKVTLTILGIFLTGLSASAAETLAGRYVPIKKEFSSDYVVHLPDTKNVKPQATSIGRVEDVTIEVVNSKAFNLRIRQTTGESVVMTYVSKGHPLEYSWVKVSADSIHYEARRSTPLLFVYQFVSMDIKKVAGGVSFTVRADEQGLMNSNHDKYSFDLRDYTPQDSIIDVHQVDSQGQTRLHMAAKEGTSDLTHDLIQRGSDVLARDRDGRTPLHLAALFNNHKVIDALLQAGARIDETENSGMTPLHLANSRGASYSQTPNLESTKLLLSRGANPNILDANNQTALHLASTFLYGTAAVKLLANAQGDVNQKDRAGDTALHIASHWGHPENVTELLAAGADVASKNLLGDTAVHSAIKNYYQETTEKYLKIIDLLLKNGAEIEAKNLRGQTPLHTACLGGVNMNTRPAEFLLSKRADLHARDSLGYTPLLVAAAYDTISSVIEVLVKAGTDVNATENTGQNALHIASQRTKQDIFGKVYGEKTIVKALIEAGVDRNAKDQLGRTPLDVAVAEDIQQILRER